MVYKNQDKFQMLVSGFAAKCICSLCHRLQIHKRTVCMKTDLGSVNRAHHCCSEVVMVASFVLCVRVCMHAKEAERARSHVGLVCTGCLVAFLVVCWSYCNSVVVVCLFADKLGPLLYNTVRPY